MVNFDTSWMMGVTKPRKTVAPRKMRIASSFFRYLPLVMNPCALIVYKKLEMKVTKMPVSTSELSSKSRSAITVGIVALFLSLMNDDEEKESRRYRLRSSNSSAMFSSSSMSSSSSTCSCRCCMKYSVRQFGHSTSDSPDFRIHRCPQKGQFSFFMPTPCAENILLGV